MQNKSKWSNVVIAFGLVMVLFAAPHLIDDFLFGVPAEFGLSVHLTQVLAGIFSVIYMGILVLLAQGKTSGLFSAMGMGGFLALAGMLKHLPRILQPGSYWSGWFSEFLILGLILFGLAVLLAGFFVLLSKEPQ